MKRFEFQPLRVTLFALLFTFLVCWQAKLDWIWWLPVFFGIFGLFFLGHQIYIYLNNLIAEHGRKQKEILAEEARAKEAKKTRGPRTVPRKRPRR